MVINPLLSGMILKLGVLYKPGVCHCICRMPLELNSLRCHRVVVSTKMSFSPLFGEESHFDQYFSDGLRPPTSSIFQSLSEEHFSRGKKKNTFGVSTWNKSPRGRRIHVEKFRKTQNTRILVNFSGLEQRFFCMEFVVLSGEDCSIATYYHYHP